MIVEVNNIPIEHDGTLYEKGASFSLPADQHERLKDYVTVLEENDELADKSVEDMTVAELKAYAAEHQIDLGDAAKKEDILAKIKAVQ
ncbi:hypothetical protein [Paenibacillus pinistramenti]|uniref:hypothetical protein n=1 Tax=Paenibacillus pinistramenti TaxID=1768003 RepID=UPI001109C9C2|nr:hypothetical protein [Paenibacillus pinistramenti]